MFVDASAIVAVLTGEPQAVTLIQSIEEAADPITSALAVFETVMALSRKLVQDVAKSENQTAIFLRTSGIRIVPITWAAGSEAIAAQKRYGKGRGHPAQLNMGDCFAYACARTHDVPLLFVGNDFSQTDIRSAVT